jgi:predicted nucleotidyltransferase component of viral defense system
MLHQPLINKLAQTIKTPPLNIVREHIEMEVLYQLSQTKFSERLIFYDGTSLRLAYNSFRFSEDLDFLFERHYKKDKDILEGVLQKVSKNNPGVTVEETYDKRYILFDLLHIKNPILKHPIRVKIEISKKQNGIKTENQLLSSPVSSLQPILRTANLESLQQAKIAAAQDRDEPRDWFDLWYLDQRLHKEVKPQRKFPFTKKDFQNELKRWLPRDKWKILNAVISYYDKDQLSQI